MCRDRVGTLGEEIYEIYDLGSMRRVGLFLRDSGGSMLKLVFWMRFRACRFYSLLLLLLSLPSLLFMSSSHFCEAEK